ncbi:uncharacterized protein LOC114287098 [Camellia sinensis]|uniref:uncharacterized protein LOC114287098 n=1 Tax=Camellia sinensis TaxID=4442 RepID=UPI001035F8F0|nr:uncharacterized protein LOC114287098 [Camellia sinensis]
MSDAHPKAIITDQCKAMKNAIKIVFPQVRHHWCLWHIIKKIPKKLRGYSQYESIKVALQNAVYDSFTKYEFEENWHAMVAKFNLNDNEWLGMGMLYREQHRWIPAYVKDYDNALKSKVEKETKADFKSRNQLVIESGSASSVPCISTVPHSSNIVPPSHTLPRSPPGLNTTKASITRTVLSPLVARRRGCPCTKRKVSKVDEIVNRLKGKNKKTTPIQARKVRKGEPYKLNFTSTGGVQDTRYELVRVKIFMLCIYSLMLNVKIFRLWIFSLWIYSLMLEISNQIVLIFDDKVPQDQPYYFPSMVRTENSMYVPVPHDQPYYFPSMVGTQDNMFALARVSPTQMTNNIRSTSHNQDWSTI